MKKSEQAKSEKIETYFPRVSASNERADEAHISTPQTPSDTTIEQEKND